AHPAAEIPNEAWRIEIRGGKIHLRLQIWLCLFEQRRRREIRRDERKADERDRQPDARSCGGPAAQCALRHATVDPMARQQERQERKRRQDVVRELRFHERDNKEQNSCATDEEKIERVAIATTPIGQP